MIALSTTSLDDEVELPEDAAAADHLEALAKRLDNLPRSYYLAAGAQRLTSVLGARLAAMIRQAAATHEIGDLTREALELVAVNVEVAAAPFDELFDAVRDREHAGVARRLLSDVFKAATREQRAQQADGETIGDVLDRWAREGPVAHVPTCLEPVDFRTAGGFVPGRTVVMDGAPDAGKTALAAQLADTLARSGKVAVGILAIDEEPDGIVTRLAQRLGHSRRRCEERQIETLDAIRQRTRDLPIRFWPRYDDAEDVTIEAAADRTAKLAAQLGLVPALFVDSLHTARCDAELLQRHSAFEAVAARSKALRFVARRHRAIVVSTSEMNRASYAPRDEKDQPDDMASSKFGGEYQTDVKLVLRTVKGESDLVRCTMPKNKLRPHEVADSEAKAPFFLRINRASQEIEWDPDYQPPTPGDNAADRAEERAEERMAQITADAGFLAAVIARRPGLGTRQLRAAARAEAAGGSFSIERFSVALARLEDALVVRDGKGAAKHHYLDGSALAPPIMDAVPASSRSKILVARPPSEEVAK